MKLAIHIKFHFNEATKSIRPPDFDWDPFGCSIDGIMIQFLVGDFNPQRNNQSDYKKRVIF
jgi:hypothetical protein